MNFIKMLFFFFSSRRRHTRWTGDWSSDVCSSDLNQAEEYKRTYGLNTTQLEGKVGTAIAPVFKIVAEEIKKALHFYQTEEKGEMPTSIILSGGTSGLPDAAPTLTKLLSIEVAIANPFSKINLDQTTS